MKWKLALLVALGAAGVYAVKDALGSDHQDTPEVELSPRMDINDVFAFPGSAPGRIALVLTTSSPLTPGGVGHRVVRSRSPVPAQDR